MRLSVFALVLAAGTAPALADVSIDLTPVRTDAGETYYVVEDEQNRGDSRAGRLLVLIEASKENVGKSYTMEVFHSSSEKESDGVEAYFDIGQEGKQYVQVELPAALAIGAEWWLDIKGDEPLPALEAVRFRELADAAVEEAKTPQTTSAPAEVVVQSGKTVVLPAPYCTVPARRVVRLPEARIVAMSPTVLRYRQAHPVLRGPRARVLHPAHPGPKPPAARNNARPKPAVVHRQPAPAAARASRAGASGRHRGR